MIQLKKHRRSAVITFALLFVCFVTTNALAEIPWRHSPEETITAARASGKPILVFVTTDWCHYCKKMKKETWADASVDAAVSQNFETLLLDGDRDSRIVKRLGLRGYPATLLYSPDGYFISQQGGFMPPTQTLQWLGSMRR